MSALERNRQVPALTPHKVLGPSIDGRGNPSGPREAPEQLAWGLAFPEPPERVAEVPVESREHLPQLEKFQEVLPSRRDEALFRRGVSRLIRPNLWNFQRVLHNLAATQEVPRHT